MVSDRYEIYWDDHIESYVMSNPWGALTECPNVLI